MLESVQSAVRIATATPAVIKRFTDYGLYILPIELDAVVDVEKGQDFHKSMVAAHGQDELHLPQDGRFESGKQRRPEKPPAAAPVATQTPLLPSRPPVPACSAVREKCLVS